MLNDARMTFKTNLFEGQQDSELKQKIFEGSVGVSCQKQRSTVTADSVLSTLSGIFQRYQGIYS